MSVNFAVLAVTKRISKLQQTSGINRPSIQTQFGLEIYKNYILQHIRPDVTVE
jgi:hypothetical protein